MDVAGFEEVVGTIVVEVELAADGTESWFLFRTQFVPSQEKPKGQHSPLHCNNGTVSAVVFRLLSGCAVEFCKDMSQGMVCIVEQSLPAGQQRSVVFAASGTQDEVDGQQKPEGSEACMLALHCV